MTEYISPTDTAKLVRKTLAEKFPGVKFSVKTDKYSGGSSIDVRWTNGPTQSDVEAAARHFHGTDFDGMIDLASPNGRPYMNDYIFFGRDFTDDVLQAAVEWYQGYFARPAEVEFIPSHQSGKYQISASVRTCDYNAEREIYQHMREQNYYQQVQAA